MKQNRFLVKHFVWIFMLPLLMSGCKKELIGGEKIVGTATINDNDYKEATWWAWNYKGYPSTMRLYTNYNTIHFSARLSPKKESEPSYSIHFYVNVEDNQFNINQPYKIDFYKELEIESTYWGDILPYYSENRNEILSDDADGFAFAISSTSDEPIPLKGELVLESIDRETKTYGHYSFTSPENKLVINGKFETLSSITNIIY